MKNLTYEFQELDDRQPRNVSHFAHRFFLPKKKN